MNATQYAQDATVASLMERIGEAELKQEEARNTYNRVANDANRTEEQFAAMLQELQEANQEVDRLVANLALYLSTESGQSSEEDVPDLEEVPAEEQEQEEVPPVVEAAQALVDSQNLIEGAENDAEETMPPANANAAPPHSFASAAGATGRPGTNTPTGRLSAGPQPVLELRKVWNQWDTIMAPNGVLEWIKNDLDQKRFFWRTTPTLYVADGSNIFWSKNPDDWKYKYYRRGQQKVIAEITADVVNGVKRPGPTIIVFKSKEFTRHILGYKESARVIEWRRRKFWDFMGGLCRPCESADHPNCYTCPIYIITLDIPWANLPGELGIQYEHEARDRTQHKDYNKDAPDRCMMVVTNPEGKMYQGTDGKMHPLRDPVDGGADGTDGQLSHEHCEYDDVTFSKIYWNLYRARGHDNTDNARSVVLSHKSKDTKALKPENGDQITRTDAFMRRLGNRLVVKVYTMAVPGSC